MNFFDYQAKKVWFANDHIYVELANGRKSKLPLHQFKRLAKATPEELENFEIIGGYSIHWPNIDEDLSIEGFFVNAEQEISLT